MALGGSGIEELRRLLRGIEDKCVGNRREELQFNRWRVGGCCEEGRGIEAVSVGVRIVFSGRPA
jgi:hypothetical protein